MYRRPYTVRLLITLIGGRECFDVFDGIVAASQSAAEDLAMSQLLNTFNLHASDGARPAVVRCRTGEPARDILLNWDRVESVEIAP